MFYLIYFLAVNFAAFVMCVYDKYQSQRGGWRVSEKALFTVSLLGGALAMYITMRTIRHKTRHRRFMIGLPIIIILQIILCYVFVDSSIALI